MAWKSNPFKFINSDRVDTVKIALQAVPKTFIDNPLIIQS